MGKGPRKDINTQNTLDVFFTCVAKSINPTKGAKPLPIPKIKDRKKRKNNEVEGEAEKLSPQDKAPRTDNSDEMEIEITKIIPSPRTHLTNARTKNDSKTLTKFGIIAELTPIVEKNEPVTKADLRQVLLMVTTLCQYV